MEQDGSAEVAAPKDAPSPDAPQDAAADASREAAPDAAADAPPEATFDAAPHVSFDAAPEVSFDAAPEAERADASTDAAAGRDAFAALDATDDGGRSDGALEATIDAEVGCPTGAARDAAPEIADAPAPPDGDAPAAAVTFYVALTGVDVISPTGNHRAQCDPGRDPATPFATLGRALDCIVWGLYDRPAVGATIYLRGGVYDLALDAAFISRGGASWEQPVTLASYPGEQATLRPSAARAASFVINLQHPDEHHIVFDGLVIDAANVALDAVKVTHQGSDTSRTAHHIRFQRCEVRNAGRGHGLLVGGHHSEFLDLRVHHNGLRAVGMANTGYGFYVASPDNLVERCDVYENGGYGVHVYNTRPAVPAPFTRTDRTVVRFNYVHDNARVLPYPGVILSSGEDLVAHHNVVVGAPLQVAYEGVRNAQLYNNTVVDPAGSVCVRSFTDTVFTARNNLCYASGRSLGLSDTTGVLPASNNLLNVDPLFVDRAAGDFNLSPTSPALDHGVAVAGLAFNGTSPEAGALEAPVVRAAEVLLPARDVVRVHVENNLHPPLLPATGCRGFSVTADASPIPITRCARVGLDAFDLTLASPPGRCAAVRLSYAGGDVTDSARIGGRLNAALRSFTAHVVTVP